MNSLGDAVVYTDCDLAYGCDAVYGIYSELVKTGSDLVIGSRNLQAQTATGRIYCAPKADVKDLHKADIACRRL